MSTETLDNPQSQLTVLMAVYNGMPYLPQAVESILAQTLDEWKMIIVDDGSTDDSLDYLDSLQDSRIHVLREPHRGLATSLNLGLEMCDTRYVARMDSDDVAHPERLLGQLAFLESHPQVGLVGTQVERLGLVRSAGHSRLACDHEALDADLLAGRVGLYHSTVMFRTDLVRRVGGYRDICAQDWDIYLRVSELSRLANLPQVRLAYRIHSGSIGSTRLARSREGVAYACHCARRRREGLSEITYNEFISRQRSVPSWRRVGTRIEYFARQQYRLAMIDVLGSHQLRGYGRLCFAAMCSPSLTRQRIMRVLRGQLATHRIRDEEGPLDEH